jgi:hypothetical protein
MRASGKTANHLTYVEGILKACKAENHSPSESNKQKPVILNSGQTIEAYKAEMMKKAERQNEELGWDV